MDGDVEDDNVENTGLDFPRLNVPALVAAVLDVAPGAASPMPLPAPAGDQLIGSLNGRPFVYSIDLAPGQDRTAVDFR